MSIPPAAVRIDLEVALASTLHIGTGFGLAQILDDRTVQGPHPAAPGVSLPYVPGSSLKGRLRFHARQLSDLLGWDHEQRCDAEAHLFGFPNSPGALIFCDAHIADLVLARHLAQRRNLSDSGPGRSERSFVSLSRQRRVALEQRLFRIEIADGELTFATSVEGTLPAGNVRRDVGLLIAAARDLTHLGGHKGRGLGACSIRITAVTINGEQMDWKGLVETLG